MIQPGCSRDGQPPSRDHIPQIKAQVFRLQQALQAQNRAAIDSLSSVELIDIHESSDSLLRLVYGTDANFRFGRLADVKIAYTEKRARVDCDVVDTGGKHPRPLVLTLTLIDSTWLLKRFETDTSGMPTGKLRDSTH